MTSSQKLTFAGQDITQAPYNAQMTIKAKYWWLDGFTFVQWPTSQTSLVNSVSYLKDWVISVTLRIIAPDQRRETMLSSYNALANLFNPMNGEQQLVFDEFPMSYFMAKGQKFAISDESQSPYIIELQADFGCTGPAYSLIESVSTTDVDTTPKLVTVLSMGNLNAAPRYRFIAGQAYNGAVTINNSVTSEQVSWTGVLAVGDVLDFIMDTDYGTPYTVLLNGNLAISTVNGPVWPHIPPGGSTVIFSGPNHGTLEIRWRDRFLVGQQSWGIPTEVMLSVDYGRPTLGQKINFIAQLVSQNGPLAEAITIYHYVNDVRYNDVTTFADVNGQVEFSPAMNTPGDFAYYAEFGGTEQYAPSTSSAVTVVNRANSRLTFTASATSVSVGENMKFSGQLQWWNTVSNNWEAVTVANEPIQLYYYASGGGVIVGPIIELTDINGNFSFTGSWEIIDNYVYYVKFPGDGIYGSAQSQNISINVT